MKINGQSGQFEALPTLTSEVILNKLLVLGFPFNKAFAVSIQYHGQFTSIEEILAKVYN